MSSAVLNWRLWGKPDAFLKIVFFIPSARARVIIIIANLRSVPPRASASTVEAASFVDFTTNALIASFSTLIFRQYRNPNLTVNGPELFGETGNFWPKL